MRFASGERSFTIAQLYLWIHERGSLIAWALAAGLAVNLILNQLWLTRWGIQGAVWATLVANGVVVVGTFAAMSRLGYRFSKATLWTIAAPLTLLTAWQLSLAFVLVALVLYPDARMWSREGLDRLWAKRLRMNGHLVPTVTSPEHFA